jgi:purine-binding chemotaxis protein CheW
MGALPLEGVETIAPMAELARPPGMPSPLEGLLNLGGTAVPVLRLDRLLGLPEEVPGLYSMLVVAKADGEKQPIAMLVDRVHEILHVSRDKLLPAGKEHTFNACVQAVIPAEEQMIHVLAPGRVLLETEAQLLTSFLTRERARLAEWEASIH